MDGDKPKILYFIQTPPPVHGVSTINESIWTSRIINQDFDKYLLDHRYSNSMDSLRKFTFRKVLSFFRYRRALKDMIKSVNPDLVYFSIMPVGKGFWRDYFFARTIKKTDAGLIYHLNNRGIRRGSRNPVYKACIRNVFSGSMIIHVSEGLIEEEIVPLNLKGSQTTAIPNAIVQVDYQKRKSLDERLRILFLSNLFPAKGIYELIHIFNAIAENRDNVELRIVGEFMRSRYKDKLLSLIKDSGMQDRISLSRVKSEKEKRDEYLDADIFLFPSKFKEECMPLVILEAMQFRLPVIASGIGAIPELIQTSVNGFLANPNDPAEFVRHLNTLIDDPDMRARMGEAGRRIYLENFTLDTFERKLNKTILEYLNDLR